jgi:hypothetical protein
MSVLLALLLASEPASEHRCPMCNKPEDAPRVKTVYHYVPVPHRPGDCLCYTGSQCVCEDGKCSCPLGLCACANCPGKLASKVVREAAPVVVEVAPAPLIWQAPRHRLFRWRRWGDALPRFRPLRWLVAIGVAAGLVQMENGCCLRVETRKPGPRGHAPVKTAMKLPPAAGR